MNYRFVRVYWLPLFFVCVKPKQLDRPLQYHKKWVNGPSYRRWKLNVPILANCYRLAGQLMSDLLDRSASWCTVSVRQWETYHFGRCLHRSLLDVDLDGIFTQLSPGRSVT